MDYETIIIKKEGSIAILTLNRPQQENRMNFKMANEMSHALEELDRDDKIRALVMVGAGKDFCLGWSGSEEYLNKSGLEILKFNDAAGDAEKKLFDFSKPTVVAAQGRILASGALMAAMADVTIISKDAKMGFPAINIGMSCMVALHYLKQIVGAKKALELVITGRILDSDQAEKLGLVTRVVSPEKLLETAMEVAKELANKSPLAVAFTKRANAAIRDMPIDEATQYLNEHMALLAVTEDGQEGLRARDEGRPPEWKGR